MGQSKTTQTTTKDPWSGAQPYMNDVLTQAQSLYNSGAGSGVWNGPTLSSLDPNTIESMNSIGNTARNSNTSLPFQYGNSMVGSGGISPQMYSGLGMLGNVAQGYGSTARQAGSINNGANGILGGLASGQNGITVGGQYGDIANQAQGANNDVTGGLSSLYGNTGGMNSGSLDVLARIANGQNSIGTGGQFQDVANRAGGATAADTYLGGMAQGGNTNPYLQSLLDTNSAQIANRVNSAASANGRYGSVGHEQALAKAISDANNPLLAQAYEGDRNRMLQATGQIDASRRGADASQLAALQGATGVYGQNIQNAAGAATGAANINNATTQLGAGLLGQLGGQRTQDFNTQMAALSGKAGAESGNAGISLNAANSLAGSNRADLATRMAGLSGQGTAAQGILGTLGQGQDRAAQWAGMQPSLYDFQNAGARDLGNIGQYNQARSQAEIDAQRQAFEQSQQMPWQQLQRYSQGGLGAVTPYAANAGTTTGTTTQEQNPWQTAAGLGIAGASLMMGNPAGAAGGLSSLFGGGSSISAPGFGSGNFNPNVPGGWDQTMGNPMSNPMYANYLRRFP